MGTSSRSCRGLMSELMRIVAVGWFECQAKGQGHGEPPGEERGDSQGDWG